MRIRSSEERRVATPRGRVLGGLLHPATWLGLVGALLVALGELRRLATWRQMSGQSWLTTVTSHVTAAQYPTLIVAGITALSVAWWWLRPRSATSRTLLVPLVLWTVPLLLLPPMLSTDAGSYADLGWIVNRGASPYEVGLGTTGSPFPYGSAWRGTTSVYPPLALELFGVVVRMTGSHWYWSVVGMRILALIGVALLGWATVRLARAFDGHAPNALWFAVLNPIVLLHGIGGAHVDLLMIGLVAAALALALDRRWSGVVAAAVLVGVAAAVKQPALLAVPAVAGVWLARRTPRPTALRSWLDLILVSALVGCLSLLTFVAISYGSGLGFGWIGGTGNPSNAAQTITPAYLVATLLGGGVATWTTLGRALAAGSIVGLWLAYGRREPVRFLALAALAFTLGFGVMREWYLIFPLGLIGLARLGRVSTWVVGWLASTMAVYGVFREYQRIAVLTSFQRAALLGMVAVGIGYGLRRLWDWAGERSRRTEDTRPIAVATSGG